MKSNEIIFRENVSPLGPGSKKDYHQPELIVLGDVRAYTLGGSPGLGESGNTRFPENPIESIPLPSWDEF